MVKNLDKFGVRITPHTIDMLGETVLTQYIVTAWTLDYQNFSKQCTGCLSLQSIPTAGDPNSGIVMTVVLKRRILNELLTTYLPSLLILTIVYATNFFKDFFFEAVVTVNLTSQLVLTTLFISVSGALPKTAYIKMIDIWLIFAQLIPFFEVRVKPCPDQPGITTPSSGVASHVHGCNAGRGRRKRNKSSREAGESWREARRQRQH